MLSAPRVGYFFPPLRMETKKNQKQEVSSAAAETQAGSESTNSPVKVLRIDDVSASIFARVREVSGQRVTFHSVAFSRSYRDAEGQRQYTKSFDGDDLGKVMTLAQQAREYIQSLAYPPAQA